MSFLEPDAAVPLAVRTSAAPRRVWLKLFRSRTAVIGLCLILFWVVLAALGADPAAAVADAQDAMAMVDPTRPPRIGLAPISSGATSWRG